MTEKHKRLYQLFKEIDKICKDNDIDYFMAGGTLIGVVRHKGFIPWDDDMDILMTRDNFHKFIKACETQIPQNRIVECQELNHDYHNAIARYTSTEDTAIHSNQIVHDDTAGFVVDIFALDPIEDLENGYDKYCKDLVLYCDLTNDSILYSYRWRANMLRFSWYRFKCFLFGKDKVLTELETKLFSDKEENSDYYVMRWGGCPFVFKKSMYGKGKYMDFVDIKAQVPDRTWDYLVWHYGDEWMEIPPHAEQEGHNAIFSLKQDYKTIRDDYLKVIDAKKYKRICLRNKIIATYIMSIWTVFKDFVYWLSAFKYKKKFVSFLKENRRRVRFSYKNNDFLALKELYNEFYAIQFDREYIGREDYSGIGRFNHPILIDIGYYDFEIAVKTLINTGTISKAYRLLEVIEKKKGKLTNELNVIKNDILTFRDISSKLFENELELEDTRINDLIQRYPFCVNFIKLKLRILNHFGSPKEEVSHYVSSGLMLCPDDGEFKKLNIDLIGTFDDGIIKQYVDVYFKVNNGLVHLDIERILRDNFSIVCGVAKADRNYAQKLYEILEGDELLLILYSHLQATNEDYLLASKLVGKFSNKDTAQKAFYNYCLSVCKSGKHADLFFKNHFELITESDFTTCDFDNDAFVCFVAGEYFYKRGESKKAFYMYNKASFSTDEFVVQLLKSIYKKEAKKLVNLFENFTSEHKIFEFKSVHGDGQALLDSLKRLFLIDDENGFSVDILKQICCSGD